MDLNERRERKARAIDEAIVGAKLFGERANPAELARCRYLASSRFGLLSRGLDGLV